MAKNYMVILLDDELKSARSPQELALWLRENLKNGKRFVCFSPSRNVMDSFIFISYTESRITVISRPAYKDAGLTPGQTSLSYCICERSTDDFLSMLAQNEEDELGIRALMHISRRCAGRGEYSTPYAALTEGTQAFREFDIVAKYGTLQSIQRDQPVNAKRPTGNIPFVPPASDKAHAGRAGSAGRVTLLNLLLQLILGGGHRT